MRNAWVAVLVMLAACGGSGVASSTTSPASLAGSTSTSTLPPATTTTFAEPAGITALKACRDVVPVTLPTAVEKGTAVLQTVIDACGTDAQHAVNKLTGPGSRDVAYALLTFGLEMDRAKVELDSGAYDETARVVFATAVLTFLAAIETYLGQ